MSEFELMGITETVPPKKKRQYKPKPGARGIPLDLAGGGEQLLTRAEVALMLRVTEGYLRHRGEKLLPVVKIGGAVRHRLSDVQALIGGRAANPNPQG
jgi:hypothetical protein